MALRRLEWALLSAILSLAACGDDEAGGTTATSTGAGGSSSTTTSDATTTSSTGAGGSGGDGGAGGSAPCGNGTLDAEEDCDDGNTVEGDGCNGACRVETGYTCNGEPSDCVTICGDGVLAGAETCDDGNADAGDGCDDTCAEESGFTCDGAPSVCVTTCGDGIVAGAELCDDGGAAAGDGCDDLCLVEAGFVCDEMPSVCVTTCGDGIVAGAESCDDMGVAPGDGCDDLCAVELGYTCIGDPSVCDTTCGDGISAGTEMCDDGLTVAGDGCDDLCLIEAGWACAGDPSICTTTCGDGIVAGVEECDDQGLFIGDGCDGVCVVEHGFYCNGSPSLCATQCGDGVIGGSELCDDGANSPGDGCSDLCFLELGFLCAGEPTVCSAVCGDGLIVGGESCDDGLQLPGDGCDPSCQVETGWSCVGPPSFCSTICGDGIQIPGHEQCDDGNVLPGDTCSPTCTVPIGEGCNDPLVASQASLVGSSYVWTVPAGGVVSSDLPTSCDPSGVGPDVIVKYTKISADLASGGALLHIRADVPGSTSASNFLNLEVFSGACQGGVQEKCLWYKHDWDTYLDVPAGDYYAVVTKNSTGTFPGATITVDEVAPSAAEGEGCFMPYTTASANYTPPAGPNQPHTWVLPPSINSFDMGLTWGGPGSISCDNHATYGDINGVDAVIEIDKTSSTSIFSISVQNNDPTLTQSDLDYDLLTSCDPTDPSNVSISCGANADTFASNIYGLATSTYYLWVASEATSEEFQGATVQVTELFPGPGESWPTAEPLVGSGPINPTSTLRLDAPSCLPSGVNVHWYSYVPSQGVLQVQASAPGAIGFLNATGTEVKCVNDSFTTPATLLATPGQPVYIGVQSGGPLTGLTFTELTYTGLTGVATDLGILFPTSATTDYWMASNTANIYFGGTSKVFEIPKSGNTTAAEFSTGFGITTTHLGYAAVFTQAGLLTLDTTTSASASRLFRIFDVNQAMWGPTNWDVTPTYVANAGQSLATDGIQTFMATYTTSNSVNFYAYDSFAPSTPVHLGTNTSVDSVVGLAADAMFFYVAGVEVANSIEGVFRIPRSNVAVPAQRIATIDTTTTHTQVDVDNYVNPQNLYVREYTGAAVHAVMNPGGPSPVHVGPITTLGLTGDYAMTYDHMDNVIYLYETETNSAGNIVMIQ